MRKYLTYWPIGCLLVAMLLFHGFTIQHQSFFVDEVDELGFAKGPVWDAVWMPDSMPPLFTLTLRLWRTLFSWDESGRWLSAIAGIVATGCTYGIFRKLTDHRCAILTAVLFAFCPLQLYYSQLTRGYSLMTLVAVLCIGCFLLAHANTKSKTRYWAGYIAFTVIGIYTHYYFAMIPISLAVAWLLMGKTHRIEMRYVVIGYLFVFFASLPVLAFLKVDFQYQHALREPRPLSLGAVVYTYFSYFSGYALGPSQFEIRTEPSGAVFRKAIPWLLFLSAVTAPLFILGTRALAKRRMLIPILCVTTVPLLLIGAVGALSGITYNVRFVVWFAFPISVWIGMGSMQLREERGRARWVFGVSYVLCLTLFFIANAQRVYDPRYQIEDTRSLVRYLQKSGVQDREVFVVSDYMVRPLQYYGPTVRWAELPIPGTQGIEIDDSSKLEKAIESMRFEEQGDFYVAYSRPFHGDPLGLMRRWLERDGVELEQSFAGIDLYRVDRSIARGID
jgi:hypothetical protein